MGVSRWTTGVFIKDGVGEETNMTEEFETFSRDLASLVHDHQTRGISYAEAVGALRLVAASIEAHASGGFVAHMTVIEVEQIDGDDWWKEPNGA